MRASSGIALALAMIAALLITQSDGSAAAQGERVRIEGRVWLDENRDGLIDEGEPGIQGRLVEVVSEDSNARTFDQTDADGRWSVEVPPGDWRVRWLDAIEDDFAATRLSGDNDLLEPESLSPRTNLTGNWLSAPFTATVGAAPLSIDAGYVPSEGTSIVGLTYIDVNNNGVDDGDDRPVSRAAVNLWTVKDSGELGTIIASRSSARNPAQDAVWTIRAVPSGSYQVEWEALSGTEPAVLGPPELFGNRMNPSGLSDVFVVDGEEQLQLNGAFAPLLIVNGVLWEDVNEDGLQQSNEPVFEDYSISIEDVDTRREVANERTDENGEWSAYRLEPGGTYQLELDRRFASNGLEAPANFELPFAVDPDQSELRLDIGLVRTPPRVTFGGVSAGAFGPNYFRIAGAESAADGSFTIFPFDANDLTTLDLTLGQSTFTYSPESPTQRIEMVECTGDPTAPTNITLTSPDSFAFEVDEVTDADCTVTIEDTAPRVLLTIINTTENPYGLADLNPIAPLFSILGADGSERIAAGALQSFPLYANRSYTIREVLFGLIDTAAVECDGALRISWNPVRRSPLEVLPQSRVAVDIDVGDESVTCTFVNEYRRRGDVNCDGLVTILDASIVAQHSVGLREEHSPCPIAPATGLIHKIAADSNGDQVVDILDAFRIAECSVGVANSLCREPIE